MSEPSPGSSCRLLDLRGLDRTALETLVAELGGERYRAAQILRWLHRQQIASVDEMRNLPAALRAALAGRGALRTVELEQAQQAADGAVKLRWRLHDGEQIESVFIPDAARAGRHALCISTQVGCAMGCTFCATATLKLRRHLLASEIVEQVRKANLWLASGEHATASGVLSPAFPVSQAQRGPQPAPPLRRSSGSARKSSPVQAEARIGSIVLMGMGEPLHNYGATVAALRILTDPDGHGYSPRRVTVSTVGLIEPLRRLLDDVDVQIAVSLVAARPEVRRKLIPADRQNPVADLLAACAALPIKRRRRITFEVVLIAGVNDGDDDARALARAVAPLRCKVNLIPYNPHPLASFAPPDAARVEEFQGILRAMNVGVYLRQPRGQEIAAACGMLVAQHRS
ncbi:MAG: 23S rRNA (adenine(2503)-C(2))-methyltransferase RlmN [Deltaproteobacteria bacterium]|nr:23S rRNA (adenine(2503)-C(2))-methyltransferase RlmN [Deltaproteobacteria bacterium]